MPDLFRHPTLNERYRLRRVGPRNKSGVTVGGGLLAFLPRLLRIRREQVPEIIALVPKRRGVAVGHRAGDAIIRLGEARAGLPVDLLAHVVAGVVEIGRASCGDRVCKYV